MKKYLGLFILIVILLGIGAVFSLRLISGEDNWICVDNQWVKHGNPSAPAPTTGCGTEVTNTTPEVTENPTSEPVRDTSTGPIIIEIANALATKNNWNANNLDVRINKTKGEYASGSVNFVNENGGGGLWFAARVNGTWQIVFDGNGIITCDSLKNYPQFPNTLIPTCYNQQTQTLVNR